MKDYITAEDRISEEESNKLIKALKIGLIFSLCVLASFLILILITN